MSEQPPQTDPTDSPVEPLYTHPASPFVRTEAPTPLILERPVFQAAQSTWVMYRSQIEFGLSIVAYLMVLVGTINVVKANPDAAWRYYVAVLPAIPAAFTLWFFVRALARLDELQKRIQLQALGFSLAGTALLTFGYGFLEGVGLPHLNWAFVLPLMAILWGVGAAVSTVRYRR